MRSSSMLVAAATLAILPSRAGAGGALDRFEQAHRPSDSGNSKPSSNSDDDDDDDNDYGGGYASDDSSSSTDDYDGGDSSGDGDAALGLLIACSIPPITFACFHPSHRLAREPYDEQGHYILPVEVGSEEELRQLYLPAQEDRFRWAELSISGFRAFNEPVVYSHDLEITAWLGHIVPHLRWEHFYEKLEESGEWDHLDRFGGHLGSNVIGPWLDFMEAYLLAGVGVWHGEAWTPAFEAVLDMRFYPVEPLAIRPSATMSVFGIGPVLFDVRLEAGVALGPLEIRLGPRWLAQEGAQSFWGPSAALVGRL